MFSKFLLSFSFFALSAFAASTPEAGPDLRQTCSDFFVFFANGTTEVPTLGTVVGSGFSANLGAKLAALGKSLTFEGVPYPASIAGYFTGGDEGGAKIMAVSVTSAAQRCPDAAIVISGNPYVCFWSTWWFMSEFGFCVANRINGAVTFSDPDQNDAYPGVINSRKLIFYNVGDLICLGQLIVLAPHFAYGTNVGEASDFVVAHV